MKIFSFIFFLTFICTLSYGAGGTPPSITNDAAISVGSDSINSSGWLLSTGDAPTTVRVYWGTNDVGAGTWSNMYAFSAGEWSSNSHPSLLLYPLLSSTTYFYTYEASNAAGVVRSSPSVSNTTLSSESGVSEVGGMTWVYSTNSGGISFVTTPETLNSTITSNTLFLTYRSNSLVWYTFSNTNNPSVIVDSSLKGSNGIALGVIPSGAYTEGGYSISDVYENSIRTLGSGIGYQSPGITIAMWFKCRKYPAPWSIFFASTPYTDQTPVNASQVTRAGLPDTNVLTSLIYSPPYYEVGEGLIIPSGNIISTNVWHRLVITYEKRGPLGTSSAYSALWLDKTRASSSSKDNIWPEINYWGVPVRAAYDPTVFPNMLIDDFMILPYAWYNLDVTNDWNAGRTETPFLP